MAMPYLDPVRPVIVRKGCFAARYWHRFFYGHKTQNAKQPCTQTTHRRLRVVGTHPKGNLIRLYSIRLK